ncbi:sigma-54-dependent Fis family transcriptional regulator [Nakamurella leprariae]|uniref:Sigma-54 factor interaction domain-containing protein n=1 Tax=Nakamurella leprariae TaxID=2803911 RepID=A0A939C0E1_9ACTN|nr:helix-turn-helix domain-containing protein [Nakamurella leprariae]MBM9465939.1 hypothetical protein [Nakamurella leprariae]
MTSVTAAADRGGLSHFDTPPERSGAHPVRWHDESDRPADGSSRQVVEAFARYQRKAALSMTTASQGTPPAMDRSAREAYLSSGTIGADVREVVRQSWARSARAGVDPSSLQPVYGDDEADPKVLAAVDVVLARQLDRLGREPISIIFASPSGMILRQTCPDGSLSGFLRRVSLEPGTDFGEGRVGTNGIGTALQAEKPTLIMGAEHFADELTIFACAGAPVHHPVSRSIVGIIDLTCTAANGNTLLLSYAQTVAEQIELELLQTVGGKQLALLRDYLAACRHATGPIVALNSDLVMMNHHAQQSLSDSDRAVLLARTSDARGNAKPTVFVADLPSGTLARMDYRPTFSGAELAGGVFRVGLTATRKEGGERRVEPPRLPGLAGHSRSWMRTTSALRQALRADRWAVLEGEEGVGKFALIRAMHYAEMPDRHFRMIDAQTAAEDPEGWLTAVEEEFEGPPGTLVLRHLDLLPGRMIGPLSEILLQQAAHSRNAEGHWVVATIDQAADHPAVLAQLVPIFDVTIALEPLRHRGEDIGVLAPLMLAQIAQSEEITLSARAVNQLQRHPWPGNVTQLQKVLRAVLSYKRRGVVDVADLPAECLAVGRRTLTSIESIERDAIVRSLQSQGGNKSLAAIDLGMSRATIYRKIREYSITITG